MTGAMILLIYTIFDVVFSPLRGRYVQTKLPKKQRQKTQGAQQRQLLDVLLVACGLRDSCLPDHGVNLGVEEWR